MEPSICACLDPILYARNVAEPDEQGLQVVGSCEEVAVAIACFYEAVACLAEGVYAFDALLIHDVFFDVAETQG
jgi:hypothetical protein